MARGNIWQQAVDLSDRVLQVTCGINLPKGDHWLTLVTVSLSQANERLDSIRVLLDRNHRESGVVLTRSLFELAVNLPYIAKDVPRRLPKYLKHGRIPTTNEEAEKLKEELETGSQSEVKDIIPGRAWKPLKDMCCDLGSDWLREYETFYRYASVPTHAGGFTLGKNYKQLLEQRAPSDHDKARVLVTALDFHLRVAEIAANVFPRQINLKIVKQMQSKCQKLGQSI